MHIAEVFKIASAEVIKLSREFLEVFFCGFGM